MNYNGWFHRGRLPDADIETLHKTDLIQPHPQWSDYYQWELEIEPELLDRRLRELQLEQLDRAEAILKTSHDILYAKLRENPETFIETLRVYFFRALKNFKHRYFSGNLPDCLRRYEPDDFFQEFFASISKMKYGDWEGFIQHTINENWDDGRFMGYFSRFLRQFFPGREAGDFNCLTYTLRRSLAKILENKTACEMSFDRIQDPDGTVYFVPENGKSQDADFGPLKQELEDVFAEHRKKLNKRLPGTLYYKKDAQDHARFQIHVPDLKPLVETVFHTLKQPLSKEQLVEYFSERYGLFEWRLGSLDDETKREVARSDSLSQTNDPEGEGISRRIRVHLVDSLEPLFRMIREFRRNGQGIVRAYAVDDTGERISRKQLGALKNRAEEWFCLYLWCRARAHQSDSWAEPYRKNGLFDGDQIKQTDPATPREFVSSWFGYKRAKYYKVRKSLRDQFGIDFFDSDADESVVDRFSDHLFHVCEQYGFPEKFVPGNQ